MNPYSGKIYSMKSAKYEDIDYSGAKNYTYTGKTESLGSLRCAVFTDGNGNKYLQAWQNWHLRKKGEANKQSKLNNEKVRNMVQTYMANKETFDVDDWAVRCEVSPETIKSVLGGKSWRHITAGLFQQLAAGNKNVIANAISASNKQAKKNVKLSLGMAHFMVRDHFINKVKVKALATKFCLTESSVRRVLRGESWKEATVPAIKEFAVWKK